MKCSNCFKERVKYCGRWLACDCEWMRLKDAYDRITRDLKTLAEDQPDPANAKKRTVVRCLRTTVLRDKGDEAGGRDREEEVGED